MSARIPKKEVGEMMEAVEKNDLKVLGRLGGMSRY